MLQMRYKNRNSAVYEKKTDEKFTFLPFFV